MKTCNCSVNTIDFLYENNISIKNFIKILSMYNYKTSSIYNVYKNLINQLKNDKISRSILIKRFKKTKLNDYEKYQYIWIKDHTSLDSLILAFSNYIDQIKDDEDLNMIDEYEEFEAHIGIMGSIYVCADEFYQNEN